MRLETSVNTHNDAGAKYDRWSTRHPRRLASRHSLNLDCIDLCFLLFNKTKKKQNKNPDRNMVSRKIERAKPRGAARDRGTWISDLAGESVN